MKRILTFALCLLVGAAAVAQPHKPKDLSAYPVPDIDFSVLENMPHPRIFVNAETMAQMKQSAASPKNSDYAALHKLQLGQADKYVKDRKVLVYKKDVSGRRILSISRDALARIFACSYAYVTTGKAAYAEYAEFVMNTVCDFDDWNPSHYLDTAEMGLAVSIGYDWLFDFLSPGTKAKVEQKLYENVILTTLDKKYASRCNTSNNWNQVCNAGVIATSIAVYGQHPEEARQIITRGIRQNARAVEYMYAPDGVYPEGAGYWDYGTSFQIALNTLLTNVFGTDFGLSELPGFSTTGRFFMYSQANFGQKFDYSDTGSAGSNFSEAWYFAERFNNPSYLYLLHKSVREKKARCKDRMSPLDLIYASRFVGNDIPAPADRVYYGGGSIPIVIARTGWDNDDLYLGIKGGYGGYNHGHLDVGSFVYEADGVRWASELHAPGGYSPIEKSLKPVKGKLFDTKPDSWRWKIFTYGNRDHSTLTVNGRIHDPYAVGTFTSVIDEPARIGAAIDITPVFGGDVEKAERTIVIKDNSYLEVTDVVTAPAGAAADVRFTFVTDTTPEAGRKSISLTKDEKTLTLSAKGVKVKYQTWSTDPADYPNEVNSNMKALKDKAMCGYTYTVPAGKTVTVVTTLK